MKKRILVIDDDEDIISIMNLIFKNEGYEVVCYTKEVSAEEIQLIQPDIVLLDVMIKGSKRTGDQICMEIKSHFPTKDIPVILISGEYNVPDLAARSCADAYIRKPFEIHDVLTKVSEMVA